MTTLFELLLIFAPMLKLAGFILLFIGIITLILSLLLEKPTIKARTWALILGIVFVSIPSASHIFNVRLSLIKFGLIKPDNVEYVIEKGKRILERAGKSAEQVLDRVDSAIKKSPKSAELTKKIDFTLVHEALQVNEDNEALKDLQKFLITVKSSLGTIKKVLQFIETELGVKLTEKDKQSLEQILNDDKLLKEI